MATPPVNGVVRKVRVPYSGTKRSQLSYAKLLERFDPRSRTPFAWRGRFLRPGATIPESDLWPDGPYPRTPLVLEFAGAQNPARGHNRHLSDETAILWSYDRGTGEFLELGRVVAPNKLWPMLLEPLIRDAMAKEVGIGPPIDLEAIRQRIASMLAAELDRVSDLDRGRVLTLVHDELAGRIASGDYSERTDSEKWRARLQ